MIIKYVYACGKVRTNEIHDRSHRDYGVSYKGQRPMEIHLPADADDLEKYPGGIIKGSGYALHPYGKMFMGDVEI